MAEIVVVALVVLMVAGSALTVWLASCIVPGPRCCCGAPYDEDSCEGVLLWALHAGDGT